MHLSICSEFSCCIHVQWLNIFLINFILNWKFDWIFSWNFSYIIGAPIGYKQLNLSDSRTTTAVRNMKSVVPFLHQTCRNTVYPRSSVKRFNVPDHLINWTETYADYLPVFYESPHISGASWADPEIGKQKFFFLITFQYMRLNLNRFPRLSFVI